MATSIVKSATMKKVKSTPVNLFSLLIDDLDASALVEEAVKAIKEEKALEEQERRRKEWEENQEQLRHRPVDGGNQGNYRVGSNYYSGRSYDQGSNGYRRGGGTGNGNGSGHRGSRSGEHNGRNDRRAQVSHVSSPGDIVQHDDDGSTVQRKKGSKMVWVAKSGKDSNVYEENAQSDAQPKFVNGENKVAVVEKEDAGSDSADPTNCGSDSHRGQKGSWNGERNGRSNRRAEVSVSRGDIAKHGDDGWAVQRKKGSKKVMVWVAKSGMDTNVYEEKAPSDAQPKCVDGEQKVAVVEKEIAGGDSVEPTNSENQNNVFKGDAQQDSKRKSKNEIEERRQLTEEQRELRKSMTLKEYEKLQAEQISDSLSRSEERKVTLDKDFESMQLLATKKTEDSSFIKQVKQETLKKEDKSQSKEQAARKSMNITEFLKPTKHSPNYGPRRPNEQSFNGGHRSYNDRQRSNGGADIFLLNGVRPNKGRKPNGETSKVDEVNITNVRGEKQRPAGVTTDPPKVDDADQFPVLSREARS